MEQMFYFGGVAFTVWNNITIRITCSASKAMHIMGVYLANIHGEGGDMWVGGPGDRSGVLTGRCGGGFIIVIIIISFTGMRKAVSWVVVIIGCWFVGWVIISLCEECCKAQCGKPSGDGIEGGSGVGVGGGSGSCGEIVGWICKGRREEEAKAMDKGLTLPAPSVDMSHKRCLHVEGLGTAGEGAEWAAMTSLVVLQWWGSKDVRIGGFL